MAVRQILDPRWLPYCCFRRLGNGTCGGYNWACTPPVVIQVAFNSWKAKHDAVKQIRVVQSHTYNVFDGRIYRNISHAMWFH